MSVHVRLIPSGVSPKSKQGLRDVPSAEGDLGPLNARKLSGETRAQTSSKTNPVHPSGAHTGSKSMQVSRSSPTAPGAWCGSSLQCAVIPNSVASVMSSGQTRPPAGGRQPGRPTPPPHSLPPPLDLSTVNAGDSLNRWLHGLENDWQLTNNK